MILNKDEKMTARVHCPEGHDIEVDVRMDTAEAPVAVLCPECQRRFSVWLKMESRPVVVTNSDPEWIAGR